MKLRSHAGEKKWSTVTYPNFHYEDPNKTAQLNHANYNSVDRLMVISGYTLGYGGKYGFKSW